MSSSKTAMAAVFNEVGKPLSLEHIDVPTIGADEVLVRITCCTICGSDLHTFLGNRPGPTPSILGHEILGVVEEIGPAEPVARVNLKIGDLITWSVAASCGCCGRCDSGMPQKCESLFKYGHEAITTNTNQSLSGGLAEYCVLQPGTAIAKLPTTIADTVFCPASCATATVAAAVRHAGDLANKRVLIFGAGMLGLTTTAFASVGHAAMVQVCDTNQTRRERSLQFGATHVGDSPGEERFDCVFEMSGHPRAVEAAINAADVGGKVVLVGSVSPSAPVAVDPEQVVRRLLSIHGVHNYRPDDLATAVEFLTQNHGRFPFAELVEREFSLSEANAAFEFATTQKPIRVAVRP